MTVRLPRQRSVVITPPASPTGKTLFRCPERPCTPREFLLGRPPRGRSIPEQFASRVRRTPGTVGMTCPYCGTDAPDDRFRHPRDRQYVDRRIEWEGEQFAEQAIEAVINDLTKQFRGIAKKSGGLLKVKVKQKPTFRRRPPPLKPYRSDLLRNIACHICRREYGVFAIALFCPDCGGGNLSTHATRECDIIEAELTEATEVLKGGDRERYERRIGNAHEDVVSAVEATLKALYIFVVRVRYSKEEADAKVEKIGNAFQNVERSRDLFVKLGLDPYGGMASDGLDDFRTTLEKRHVVTHNLGLADERYVARTGQGRPGTNVAVTPDEVRLMMKSFLAVVDHCEQTIPELSPAGAAASA